MFHIFSSPCPILQKGNLFIKAFQLKFSGTKEKNPIYSISIEDCANNCSWMSMSNTFHIKIFMMLLQNISSFILSKFPRFANAIGNILIAAPLAPASR
jgi:hypothetical protein